MSSLNRVSFTFWSSFLAYCPGRNLQYSVEWKWCKWTSLICFWSKGESIQSFTISWLDFYRYPLLGWRRFLFFLVCWVFFYHKKLGLSDAFYFDDYMAFVFNPVDRVCYINWFWDVKPSLHSCDKPHLVMLHTTTYMIGVMFLVFCWRFFCPYSYKILVFSFLWCLWLCYQGNNGFIEWVGECSLIYFFWKS